MSEFYIFVVDSDIDSSDDGWFHQCNAENVADALRKSVVYAPVHGDSEKYVVTVYDKKDFDPNNEDSPTVLSSEVTAPSPYMAILAALRHVINAKS